MNEYPMFGTSAPINTQGMNTWYRSRKELSEEGVRTWYRSIKELPNVRTRGTQTVASDEANCATQTETNDRVVCCYEETGQ